MFLYVKYQNLLHMSRGLGVPVGTEAVINLSIPFLGLEVTTSGRKGAKMKGRS